MFGIIFSMGKDDCIYTTQNYFYGQNHQHFYQFPVTYKVKKEPRQRQLYLHTFIEI